MVAVSLKGEKNMFLTIASIVLAVVAVLVIVVICLQKAKTSGLGAGIAGGSETYWSRNKGKSKEGRLVRATIILAVLFFVLAILLNIKGLVG